MLVVQLIRDGNHLGVPLVPSSTLVTADEKNGRPFRIERKQDAQVTSERSQLLHVRVPRPMHTVDEWPPQRGSSLLEDFNGCVDGNLLILIQGIPPGGELVRVFDFPDKDLPSNA
jgi:hypothetical protein